MTQEQIAERLKTATNGKVYQGSLTGYAAKSIESGRSNYPVSNLIAYCKDMGLTLTMCDMATLDSFHPESVLDIHKVLKLLMQRYDVNEKLVYRKTAAYYTPPKTLDEHELERLKSLPGGKKHVIPLSIKTLLAVCEVIHCDLLFEPK